MNICSSAIKHMFSKNSWGYMSVLAVYFIFNVTKETSMASIVISVISLLVSMCSTFYYTRKSNQLSVRARITDLIDKIYNLAYDRICLQLNKEQGYTSKLAEKQLRMKHLLFEIDDLAQNEPLSQSQNRLLAESFDDLLYFDYAQKYWDKVFEKSFVTPELEAEYYRRYGQFLYTTGDYAKAYTIFEKSLTLSNDSENRKIINFQTYTDWAELEFKREVHNYYLSKGNLKDICLPKFENVYTILQKANSLLEQFKSYSFYNNAVEDYDHIIMLITAFKNKHLQQIQNV